MAALLKRVETFRLDSEEEVEAFLDNIKETALEEGYTLTSYRSTLKEKKAKGEVIDSGIEFTCTKEFEKFWEV